MEEESIETFLKRLKLESYIKHFRENMVPLNLLKELPEDLLKETLKELELPIGVRMAIAKEMRCLKAEGK